jgi:prepilin-type processing-associated H-X9-DG protein
MKHLRERLPRTLAFTLTEVLVLGSIASILGALVLPVLNDAKAQARAAFCMNNLKQWGIGFKLYAADWKGYLPAEGAANLTTRSNCWYNAVPPSLRMMSYAQMHAGPGGPLAFLNLRVWSCPEKNIRNARSVSGMSPFDYAMNDWLDGSTTDDSTHHLQQAKLSAITVPSETVLLFDVQEDQPYGAPDSPGASIFLNWPYPNLHNGGCHFLFVDGHVAWFPTSAYNVGGVGITNYPGLRWHP